MIGSGESSATLPVRGLTMHQPWATLVAERVKRIETRSWLPPRDLRAGFRLLVHAGVRLDPCWQTEPFASVLWAAAYPDAADIPLGAVVAVARVDRAVRHPGGLTVGEVLDQEPWGGFGPGRCYWLLADVVKLTAPVPVRGQQGLWRPVTATLDEVHARLPEGSSWAP